MVILPIRPAPATTLPCVGQSFTSSSSTKNDDANPLSRPRRRRLGATRRLIRLISRSDDAFMLPFQPSAPRQAETYLLRRVRRAHENPRPRPSLSLLFLRLCGVFVSIIGNYSYNWALSAEARRRAPIAATRAPFSAVYRSQLCAVRVLKPALRGFLRRWCGSTTLDVGEEGRRTPSRRHGVHSTTVIPPIVLLGLLSS